MYWRIDLEGRSFREVNLELRHCSALERGEDLQAYSSYHL